MLTHRNEVMPIVDALVLEQAPPPCTASICAGSFLQQVTFAPANMHGSAVSMLGRIRDLTFPLCLEVVELAEPNVLFPCNDVVMSRVWK